MWIPGFGSDEIRPYKKACTTEAHKQVSHRSHALKLIPQDDFEKQITCIPKYLFLFFQRMALIRKTTKK